MGIWKFFIEFWITERKRNLKRYQYICMVFGLDELRWDETNNETMSQYLRTNILKIKTTFMKILVHIIYFVFCISFYLEDNEILIARPDHVWIVWCLFHVSGHPRVLPLKKNSVITSYIDHHKNHIINLTGIN